MKTYADFITNWMSGINNEIRYWNWWVLTGGGTYDQEHFEELKSGYAKFQLEHLVKEYPVKVLDVGTAILSTVGNQTPLGRVDLTAVDPLAFGYKVILDKNNLTPYVETEFCLTETLDEKFATNTFDIVNMRNALDHSFNPIVGIYQMLSVCKIGGIVHLWHNQNEAEYEKYVGFHQWNIDEQDGNLIIWNRDSKHNVNELLKDFADVKTSRDFVDDREIVIAVITKKANFIIPEKVDSFKIMQAMMQKVCMDAQEIYECNLVPKTQVKRLKLFGIEILKKTTAPDSKEIRLLGIIKWKRNNEHKKTVSSK